MAKVRLQARGASEPEEQDSGTESETEILSMHSAEEGSLTASYAEVTKHGKNATHSPPPSKSQGSAIALLAKVLREDGFVGWYQVRNLEIRGLWFFTNLALYLGDGCADHKSSIVAGAPIHAQRPVRALRLGDNAIHPETPLFPINANDPQLLVF
jgi:hypothetical protein